MAYGAALAAGRRIHDAALRQANTLFEARAAAADRRFDPERHGLAELKVRNEAYRLVTAVRQSSYLRAGREHGVRYSAASTLATGASARTRNVPSASRSSSQRTTGPIFVTVQ